MQGKNAREKGNLTYAFQKNAIKIDGRLPKNSRNSFVDLQSDKTAKMKESKNRFFIEN